MCNGIMCINSELHFSPYIWEKAVQNHLITLDHVKKSSELPNFKFYHIVFY